MSKYFYLTCQNIVLHYMTCQNIFILHVKYCVHLTCQNVFISHVKIFDLTCQIIHFVFLTCQINNSITSF